MLREFRCARWLLGQFRRVVTLNDGILFEIKEVIILLRVNEVAIVILFDNWLLVITLIVHLVGGSMHLIVHESLSLEEVFAPLLLLTQLLSIGCLVFQDQSLFEFLHQTHYLE